jgi:hypothetical protein
LKRSFPLAAPAFCLLLLFTNCSKSSSSGGGSGTPAYCDGVVSKYAVDVQPIISTSCLLGSNCHSAGSTNAGGELTDYTKVFNKRGQIRAAVNSGIMPQTGTLTEAQKKKIISWIDAGALNN